jgi:hypothetical protein
MEGKLTGNVSKQRKKMEIKRPRIFFAVFLS